VINRTPEPAPYVVMDAKASPEIVQYPDSGKFAAMSRAETPFWTVHRLEDAADFFDGEDPRA
jgi:hypothetical protein